MTPRPSHDTGQRTWLDGPLFVLFIAALMSVLSLSLDILLPVLPDISADLGLAEPARVRMILTMFIAAFGLGHLVMGLLADRFGRRVVLLGSLATFLITGLICAYANSFETLLAGRILQGFAAAGPRVIAVAIARDLRSGPALARALSLAMMIFMAGPIIAPILGEGVATIGGWRAVFVALCLMALPAFAVVLLALPETCPPDHRQALSRHQMTANLTRLARCPQTTGYTAICTLTYGIMFGVIGIAPIIYDQQFAITTGFAGYFATLGAGIAVAAFVNARLVMSLGSVRILRLGLMALTVIAAGFVVTCLVTQPPFWLFHLFILLLMSAKGLVFSNCNALAVDPHRAFAGFASAMIGGCTMLGSGILAQGIGGLYDGRITSLALTYMLVALLALAIAWMTGRRA